MKYEYKILVDEKLDLEEVVAEYLADGWSCQGGVSWQNGGDYAFYCQAMVRESVEVTNDI